MKPVSLAPLVNDPNAGPVAMVFDAHANESNHDKVKPISLDDSGNDVSGDANQPLGTESIVLDDVGGRLMLHMFNLLLMVVRVLTSLLWSNWFPVRVRILKLL